MVKGKQGIADELNLALIVVYNNTFFTNLQKSNDEKRK